MTLLTLLVAGITAPPSDLLAFALTRWREEPSMRVEDAYKWLYHAALGADHAVDDYESVRTWILREWSGLGPARRHEQEVVRLSPDGRWLRVNLRPYRDRGGDPEFLAALFFASAEGSSPPVTDFRREWLQLGEYLRRRSVGRIDRKAWERLDRETAAPGYPAIHHSSAYRQASRPAYRVIRGDLWIGQISQAERVEVPVVAFTACETSAPRERDHSCVVRAEIGRRANER